MNGPLNIYRTKQILRHDEEIDLPTCMYKMKNIYATKNGLVGLSNGHVSEGSEKLDAVFDKVKEFLKNQQNNPEMSELQQRQKQILAQLAELKQQLLETKELLKDKYGKEDVHSSSSSTPQKAQDMPNFVINASPDYPPYSLRYIQRLWQLEVHFKIKTHVHSSVAALPIRLQEFSQELCNFKPKRNVPVVNIMLIWKNVGPFMELLVTRFPIRGEVNMLRYLSRLSASSLNYENQPNATEIDRLLDSCFKLVLSTSKTARVPLFQALNRALGKNCWFGDKNTPNIVDIAVYSTLKQVPDFSEVTVNLKKWLQRFEALE